MIDNLSIPVHAFTWRMFWSLSEDKNLLPRYVNRSTNFRSLSLDSLFETHYQFYLCFVSRPIAPAACSRLCSSDSTVFARSARSAAKSASVVVSAGYRLFLVFFFFFRCKSLARNTWNYKYVQTNDYRQIKKVQLNIENASIVVIKRLVMNQISALNKVLGVDLPLNKWTKPYLCEHTLFLL